jgi:hypothetical protein
MKGQENLDRMIRKTYRRDNYLNALVESSDGRGGTIHNAIVTTRKYGLLKGST